MKVTSLHTMYDICIEIPELQGLRHEITPRLERALGEVPDTWTSGCTIHIPNSSHTPEEVMDELSQIIDEMRFEAEKVMALLNSGQDKDKTL